MRWSLTLFLTLALAAVCCDDSRSHDDNGDSPAEPNRDVPGADDNQDDDDDEPVPSDSGGPDLPSPGGWAPLAWEDCEGGGRLLEAGPDDYRTVLDTLEPGDTLRLRPGDYLRGLPLALNGEEGRCIVIEGVPDQARPVIRGSNAFNLIELREASWIKVRGLDLQGDGMEGFGVSSQGGDSGFAHHIVIEDLHLTGFGADQQIVGISTKSTCWDWVIRGNTIVGAGTGIYLGNSDGTSPFLRGLIEFNVILDTLGYNMQVKHQPSRPELSGIPTEPSVTVIRYNVFSKQDGSSSGGDARPNLLLGHQPPSGVGENDRFFVYGNFFYQNPTENLVQAEGNVAIYNNVLVNRGGGGLLVQPHNGVPRDIDVFFNTVVTNGAPIRISGGASGHEQRARYNAVFAPEGISATDAHDNVEGSLADAEARLADATGELGSLDLHPRPGQLGASVDLAELSAYLDADLDFDGRQRSGAWLGAYAGTATATSWQLGRSARPYDR